MGLWYIYILVSSGVVGWLLSKVFDRRKKAFIHLVAILIMINVSILIDFNGFVPEYWDFSFYLHYFFVPIIVSLIVSMIIPDRSA